MVPKQDNPPAHVGPKPLPKDREALRVILRATEKMLNFLEPTLDAQRQRLNELRKALKEPYGILTKTSFLRAITEAQEKRFAQGGPSGSANLPYLDGVSFDAALKKMKEAIARMGTLAAAKPANVEGWRPCIAAFGDMVAAQDVLIGHFRRLQQRVIAGLDSIDQTSADKADKNADRGAGGRIRVPKNPAVLQLAQKIDKELDQETSEMDIARQFTGGNEKRARSLLRQLRRYPHLRRPRK